MKQKTNRCNICGKRIFQGKDNKWYHQHKRVTERVMERLLGKAHNAIPRIN